MNTPTTIRAISQASQLDVLEPLWIALHHHHRKVSTFRGLVDDDVASWSRRKALYESWLTGGSAVILVAEQEERAVGYVVAHLEEGPDDTFAVGDKFADVYSLSVASSVRGQGIGTQLMDELDRQLEQLGIHDGVVAVMTGNDDAVHFYLRRGFEPAEVYLWRVREPRDT